jgi:hypothetical protein
MADTEPAATPTPTVPATAGVAADDTEARDRAKRWRSVAKKQLDYLMSTQYADTFAKPVSERSAPDYHTIVRRPMDFGTVGTRLTRDGVRACCAFLFPLPPTHAEAVLRTLAWGRPSIRPTN